MNLDDSQRQLAAYWLPGLIAGALGWLVFVTLGHTPPIRASALALVVVGMAMLLRRNGAALAIIGGLALAFSPAFWSQTGPAGDLSLSLTVAVLAAVLLVVVLLVRFSRRGLLSLIIGFAVFAVLYWSQLSGMGSLRLTTLSAAWLLYLLVDALFLTNPHPDDPPTADLKPYHIFGILVLLAVGVINAPLFILLAPAVALGLLLTRARLPWWYWLLLALIVGVGLYGISANYMSSTWWRYPAAQAHALGLRVPFMLADGWREAERWVMLVDVVIGQFTILGVALGVLGLSRLSRWYPPIGTVTMVAYAMHALFGLLYFGNDGVVLLLPLLMVQIFWMTYAVYVLGEWLQRSMRLPNRMLRWLAPAVYVWLPVLMLMRIAATV